MRNTEQEVTRILEAFENPNLKKFTKPIVEKVFIIQSFLDPRLKYHKAEKLVPLIIYISLTLRSFIINKSKLIQVSNILSEEFYGFFYQMKLSLSKYGWSGNYV